MFFVVLVPSYKNRGVPYTTKMYEEQVFTMDDIFAKETLEKINNKSLFEVYDVRTINYGLSIALCSLKNVKIYDEINFQLKKKEWDVNIFFHPKGDELWFAFPGMAILKLPKNNVFFSMLAFLRRVSFWFLFQSSLHTLHTLHTLQIIFSS